MIQKESTNGNTHSWSSRRLRGGEKGRLAVLLAKLPIKRPTSHFLTSPPAVA